MPLNSSTYKAQQAFEAIMSKATTLRSALQSQRAILVVNGASADVVLNTMRGVKASRDIMTEQVGTAGLQAYARFVYDNPALDFISGVNSAVAACNTALVWVANNFPKDANGYLLKDTIVNGEITPRTFTAAALSGFVTQIDAVIASL